MAEKKERMDGWPHTGSLLIFVAVLMGAAILGYAMVIAEGEGGQMEISMGDVLEHPPEHTISVEGEAQRSVSPDLLALGFTVETTEESAELSQSENARIISGVKAALLAKGVKEEDIKTSSYSVYPDERGRWVCPEGHPECEDWEKEYLTYLAGYKTVHSLAVETEDLESGGGLVDAGVNAGASDVDYISFTMKDETRAQLEQELLKEAGENAVQKAGQIAAGLGVGVGEVASASEGYIYYPTARSYDYVYAEAAGADYSTELSPGELTISASVSASFIIE